MRILHILNHSLPYRQDGYSIRSAYILQHQNEAGLDSLALTPPGFPTNEGIVDIREEKWNGITYIRQSIPKPDRVLLRYVARQFARKNLRNPEVSESIRSHHLRIRLSDVLNKYKPDIIHVASPARNALVAIQVGNKAKIPIVYEVRGLWHDTAVTLGIFNATSIEYKKRQADFISAMDRAHTVVTLSHTMKREFVDLGIPPDKISIISNGVDVDKFSPGARPRGLASHLGITSKHVVIGYIGSIRSLEGLDILLRAVDILKKEFGHLRVLIVGQGEELNNLSRQIEKLELENIVKLVGEVSHGEIVDYYNLFDINVLPRISERVTNLVTPIKPFEAMAMKNALIVSDVDALCEIVQDKITGLTFRAESPHDLADRLKEAIRDSSLRARLGESARNWVCVERTWRKVVSHYESIYAGL